MPKEFVVDGATLECSFGTVSSKLSVVSQKRKSFFGKKRANVIDSVTGVNISSFGTCTVSSPPKPCTPVCTLWLPGESSIRIGGRSALVDSDIAVCKVGGGIIKITDSGQSAGILEFFGLLGDRRSNQFGGDPVNMATGNFIHKKELMAKNGPFPISFKIFYNAQDKKKNSLGYGWIHNYEICVAKDINQVTVFLENAKQEAFYKGDNGGYFQSQGLSSSLSEKDSIFSYLTHDGVKYFFEASGKLIKKEDRNSNFVLFSYDEHNNLLKVSNNSGSELNYSYERDRIKQVSDNCGRTIRFEYCNDTLACLTDEAGNKYIFKYDCQHRLSKAINPIGIEILNKYNEDFRINKQVFPDGGAITYDYDDEENQLILTEQNGNKVIHVHDGLFRSVAAIYEDGIERYRYNAQNLRTMHMDKNGNITRYSYDKRCNLVEITNPLKETFSTEYNNLNKPVSIKVCEVEKFKTRYDSNGNATEMTDALGRSSRFEYNSRGQPIKISLPDNSEICLEYDKHGNVVAVTGSGLTTKYEYDSLNRIVRTTDGNGNRTGFEYNLKGNITKVTNALGNERKYEYNAMGKVTSITDFDGRVISREFNCMGKPVRLIDPEGNVTEFEYDLMWNVAKQIDANGNTMLYCYNKMNKLERVVNSIGAETNYEYDPNGNRVKIRWPNGGETSFSYDKLNRINEVVEANGAKTNFEYDSMGQLTKVIDALGNVRTSVYDEAGQKIYEVDPCGRKLEYSYSLLGKIEKIVDSAGRKTQYEYMPGGILKSVTYPDHRKVEYAYDSNKNIISQTLQDGYELKYEYDCLNRITVISSNKGQVKKYSYDAVGNVTAITDSNNNTTKYIYSAVGNLQAVVDPLGNRTNFRYDSLSHLTEIEQFMELHEARTVNSQNSETRITRYKRNELGQVEQIIDSLGNAEEYSYDCMGNIISKLDREGYLTSFEYDITNKLEKITYADGKSVNFSYNLLKQLTEISDWLGITSIEVDELGRAKMVTDPQGGVVEYAFGSEGERKSMKYPNGQIVEYQYDDALRLKSLVSNDMGVEYAYDANSRLSEKRFSNGTDTKYFYNDRGLLSELIHGDKAGILDKYVYTYDNTVNAIGIEKYRRGMEEDSGTFEYTYDELSRLTGVVKDGIKIKSYGYDEFNNRSVMVENGITTNYTYNPLNQLTSLKNVYSAKDFSYDARGNMTQILEKGKVRNTYEYGPTNRLSRATNSEGQVAEYEYNGLGFKIDKKTSEGVNPSKNIGYVPDLTKQYNNLLQMTDDKETKNYFWDYSVAAESGGNGGLFYLHDELGSTLRLTNSDGMLVDSYCYDEFGKDLYGNQGKIQPFGFTGYSVDRIAELCHTQARHYSPLVGRMVSEDKWFGDPYNPQSLNKYIYCFNNPIAYVDLNGNIPSPAQIWDSVKDGVRTVVKGGERAINDGFIFVSDVISEYTPFDISLNTANVGASALMMDMDEFGIYHASEDCWQQIWGYNGLYDFIFDLGTSAKPEKYNFSHNDQKHRLWVWKGDYLNLGAGAELGIYRQLSVFGANMPHWLVDKDLSLPMQMAVMDNNYNLIASYDPSSPQWWITSFNPEFQSIKEGNLRAFFSVDFSGNVSMYDSFKREWGDEDTPWIFSDDMHIAFYCF